MVYVWLLPQFTVVAPTGLILPLEPAVARDGICIECKCCADAVRSLNISKCMRSDRTLRYVIYRTSTML